MLKTFYRVLIELTNRKWSSVLLRLFTRSKLSKLVIPSFIKIYHIPHEESEKHYKDFDTLSDFFVRKLKSESRPIDNETASVISPVDAVIDAVGEISESTELFVKGKIYSVAEMLGSNEAADKYKNGTFIVFYLSPKDYHRIHSPLKGMIINHWELGGRSYPVNKLGLLYGKDVLSKNYRRITEIRHRNGLMALVKVGAMFVNCIETTYTRENVEKGEEIAFFTFGSTVILLFEKGTFKLNEKLSVPYVIKMGEKVGTILSKDK